LTKVRGPPSSTFPSYVDAPCVVRLSSCVTPFPHCFGFDPPSFFSVFLFCPGDAFSRLPRKNASKLFSHFFNAPVCFLAFSTTHNMHVQVAETRLLSLKLSFLFLPPQSGLSFTFLRPETLSRRARLSRPHEVPPLFCSLSAVPLVFFFFTGFSLFRTLLPYLSGTRSSFPVRLPPPFHVPQKGNLILRDRVVGEPTSTFPLPDPLLPLLVSPPPIPLPRTSSPDLLHPAFPPS